MKNFIVLRWIIRKVKVIVAQLCPTLCDPQTVARWLLCPWDFLGKNTGVDCHSLLQGIFLTRDQTQVSCIAGRFFPIWATREVQNITKCIRYLVAAVLGFLCYGAAPNSVLNSSLLHSLWLPFWIIIITVSRSLRRCHISHSLHIYVQTLSL